MLFCFDNDPYEDDNDESYDSTQDLTVVDMLNSNPLLEVLLE